MELPRTGEGAVTRWTETAAANRKLLGELYESDLTRIEEELNLVYEIGAQFSWMFDTAFAPRTDAQRVAFWLFQKHNFAVFNAFELLRRGAFGSSRVLLRQAFEALVLGKFCTASEDESLAVKWKDGGIIYLGKDVFRQIEVPDPTPLEMLWGVLSDYLHASIFSQQGDTRVSDETELREVNLTVTYIDMLLECSYHLLNSCIVDRSMQYYASTYGRNYAVPELRREARRRFKHARHRYGKEARSFVQTYKRRWQLRPVEPEELVRTPRYYESIARL